MSYIICIPSYKRSEICNRKTLNTLKQNNIDSNLIFVYVIEEEYTQYETTLDKTLYNSLVIGKKGLTQQKQFIMNQWEDGKHILFFDDDIDSIDLSLTNYLSLHSFIDQAFEECHKRNSFIWGVYPVFNPFFRKPREEISTCLNFIVGAFYGIINRPNLESITLHLTNGHKEDVERTIKYFIQDGIVLRFNKVGFKTKYYGSVGGLGSLKERLKPIFEEAHILKKEYPKYGNIFTRKTGITEFRLRKIR
jgi:hypothetical protein